METPMVFIVGNPIGSQSPPLEAQLDRCQKVSIDVEPDGSRGSLDLSKYRTMLIRAAVKTISMEGVVLNNQQLGIEVNSFNGKNEARQHTLAPFVQACSLAVTGNFTFCINSELPKMASRGNDAVKVFATRRRRIAYSRTETYVLMEPGQEERFVSEEELKARLTYWLENWPGKVLPRDLARFATIDEAVSFLVSSVCELELEGDVGSLQWYEVRLD